MKRVGEFCEFWGGKSCVAIRDALGRLDDVERRLAGLYLAQGHAVRYTMERRRDVLDDEEVFLSSGLRTDGSWYWRADLAHYVLKYGVQLPQEFLFHASSNNWQPPTLPESELRSIATTIRAQLDNECAEG